MRILLTALSTTLIALCWQAAPAEELPAPIAQALQSLNVSADDVSFLIEPAEGGEPLLSHHPDTARNPASVMKLVTTWSALEQLGPAFTWPTEVYFLDDFDGQVLYGDIGIKGYGDPFFVAEEMWKMLRVLRRLGLEDIQGDLRVDTSHFFVERRDPGAFDSQPFRTYNVPPSALLANFKALRLQFFADRENNRVRVVTEPPLANIDIRNRLRLVDGPCAAYQAGVAFNVTDPYPGAMRRIELDGNFSTRCNGYAMTRTVLENDQYFYGLFRALWGELGGRIEGDVVNGAIPVDADRVLTWRSRPLGEVIRSINKNSNNVMTRQLLLTLGALSVEPPGTVENGVAAINTLLTERNIHDGSLVIENGAGLSRNARVSARMLLNLLQAAYRSPFAPEFFASLSLAGEDGTTRGRFDDSDTVLHVKTGRLDHVTALAGIGHAADGRQYVLAILVNAPEAHRGIGQEIEEAVLRWLETRI